VIYYSCGPLLFWCGWILSQRYENALRLELFCYLLVWFAMVFTCFELRFRPFVLGMGGTVSILCLGDVGVCICEPLMFARVLTCFDLRVRPRLKDGWGLLL
jgi:hypothetical protein